MTPVIEKVVKNGWCIGCGMCAAICPRKRLSIRWNKRGEYNPVELEECQDCDANCNLCYQVCPAHGQNDNETQVGDQLYGHQKNIKFKSLTGFYVSSWLGYSKINGHRINGASGGMATWTLEKLLESGEVDSVVCVGRTADSDKLFDFKICKTVEEIRQYGRSAYYAVESSGAIKHILENEGSYAITALPCLCKAIRLAQKKIPKLKERVKYVLGLTCGHSCSKYFAEYLCAWSGGDPSNLREVIFRVKDENELISNMGMYFESGRGKDKKIGCHRWKEEFGYAFMNGYFELQGCFFCDDVFAECADAAFMDAWLPEFSNDTKGHSIILVRDNRIDSMLKSDSNKILEHRGISIDKVIESQTSAIKLKHRFREVHLREIRKKNEPLPLRRDPLLKPYINPFRNIVVRLHRKISVHTGYMWFEKGRDITKFKDAMKGLRKKLRFYNVCASLHRIPIILFRRIKRMFVTKKQNLFREI